MNKRLRQSLGCLCALIGYYLVHEGAHFLYAWSIGAFRELRFLGLGIQVDVYPDRMTDVQMGWFCLMGVAATALAGCILAALAPKIGRHPSNFFKVCMYYLTLAFLFVDPLYLSVLCGFVGGGDMNGIGYLLPQPIARSLFGAMLFFNTALFLKYILPTYQKAFS